MDKLQMAHDWALAFIQHNKDLSVAAKTVSAWAFDYADAMKAEADKRSKAEAEQKRKAVREMLNADNTFLEKEGQHFDDVEEWQPDKCNNPQPVITDQDKQRAEQAYSNIVKPPITEEWQPDWSQAPHPDAVGFKITNGNVEFLIGHRGVDGKLSIGYSEFTDDWNPIEHYHDLHNDYLRKRPTNI